MHPFIQKIHQEIIDKNQKISSSKLLWFFRKHGEVREELFRLTEKCTGNENFMERIFWIENSLDDYIRCANQECGKPITGIIRWQNPNPKYPIQSTKSNHRVTCCNTCKFKLHHIRHAEVHEKRTETMISRFGVENPAYLETNIAKTNNPMRNATNVEKVKKTCMEKYGVDNPSKSVEIIEKIRTSSKKSYEEQLIVNTKREDTCMGLYGATFVAQVPEFKEKTKSTCLEKYGVHHVMQNIEIFNSAQHQGRHAKEYIFPSGKIVKIRGFEWKALDLLLQTYQEDELIVETKKIPRIKYSWDDGSEHYYFPDIFIPNEKLIIEVKSKYTFNCDLRKNLLKEAATKQAGYNFQFMIF